MINLIENLCRTCMGEEESVYFTTPKSQSNQILFSIFNGPQHNTANGSIYIKELLEQATPQLSIDKDDLLPKSVCKSCLDKLVNVYDFQQKCLLAEMKLKDLAKDSNVAMRLMDHEDDPLTYRKIPEEFTDIHNILKIEMDEVLMDENNHTNNDIASKPIDIYEHGATNGSKKYCGDGVEQFQSSDLSSSKKLKRIRKLARKQGIEKLTENRETTGELTDSEEKLFACKDCGKTLKTLKTLKSHIKTHHRLNVCEKKQKTGEYRYDNSENKVTGVSELESAISVCKNQEISEDCPNDTKEDSSAVYDIDRPPHKVQDVIEENVFACDQCGSRFKKRKSLNSHQKLHQRNQIGDKKLEVSAYAWSSDSPEDTDDEDFDPHDVHNDRQTNSKETLKKERASTKELEKDVQKTAETQETDISDLKHQVPGDDKPFECDECGSRVKTQKSLKRHKRIHLRLPGEKAQRSKTTYECKYCQKVFCQSSSLKDHMRVHTGEKPFLCSECGKAFKILSNMKQHFLRHGSDRPYECPNCPKRFPCLTDLASHAAVHNKAKTHVCDICGSAFVKPYLLKKHKMYHTGEKNHKCDYCDMRFVLAEQCRRHMRIHTGEKPYKCKYCSRAFAQSNDLTKHLRVHLGDSVYKCDLCPQGFRLLGDLRTHFNTHKNDDDETRQRNLQALKEDEMRLQLRFGLVQTTEAVS